MYTAYLANQLGFSEHGRFYLRDVIIPELNEIGLNVIEPFQSAEKTVLSDITQNNVNDIRRVNVSIGKLNINSLVSSDLMLAILDGGHTVDDGVASEIGFYAGLKRGPIFALRTDFRLAENAYANINIQIEAFIQYSGGGLVCMRDGFNVWIETISNWIKRNIQVDAG